MVYCEKFVLLLCVEFINQECQDALREKYLSLLFKLVIQECRGILREICFIVMCSLYQ